MIEVRNVKLALSGGSAGERPYDPERLRAIVARRLGVPEGDIASCDVVRRSVDARNKGDVHFVATIASGLLGGEARESKLVSELANRDVSMRAVDLYVPPKLIVSPPNDPPVVIGAGAAGLFCALALAEAGVAPVLIERGMPAVRRAADVARFNETGDLDPESNIQFGAGGAGTFSDGKLTTGTSSPAHAWIASRFVEMGASPDILWQAKPHIGSDVLPTVVDNIAARIVACGGRIEWGARMVDFAVGASGIASIACERRDADGNTTTFEIACSSCVLACGHSARDVFELLRQRRVALEPKVFSMGFRIEHPQSLVDRAQYGKAAGHPSLPPADYKLSWHDDDGRGVYTFCMCPGGTVVAAASEPGGVVTNGMSVFARDGSNANSALLVNVYPEDIEGIGDDVLAGVEMQRAIERRSFEAGGGAYVAPAQLLGDFLQGVASRGAGSVCPTYPRGVAWCDLNDLLPGYITGAMAAAVAPMARKLRGFDLADAVLTGCETRSSSPVRVVRGQDLCSVSVDGLYPCGEGAGYAGGIMSAASDGLRCAAAVVDRLNARVRL